MSLHYLFIEVILLCWPHICRTSVSGPSYRRLTVKTQFTAIAQKDIEMLHLCRNLAQFQLLAKLVFHKWTRLGESAVARCFHGEYMTAPYEHWFVTASEIPGVLPDNNAAESWHRDIKRLPHGMIMLYLKDKMLNVLNCIRSRACWPVSQRNCRRVV